MAKKELAIRGKELEKDVYEDVVVEIEAVCVERVFNSRWERVMQYHDIGRILQEREAEGYSITELVKELADDERMRDQHMGKTNLWFAVALHKAFPDKNFPDEKNTSVGKLKKLLVPEKFEEKEAKTAGEIAMDIFSKHPYPAIKFVYEELGKLIRNYEIVNTKDNE